MPETGNRLGLTFKPGSEIGFGSQAGGLNFNGHGAVQTIVAALIDFRHATPRD